MYFLRGILPWQGLKVEKKEDRYKKIYEKKKITTAEELCAGFPRKCFHLIKTILVEFTTYINYTRNLGFEEEPKYDYLRGLFRSLMDANSHTYDFIFDWTKPGQNLPKPKPKVR